MDTMASQITSLRIVYLPVYYIKVPRQWPLWGELTRERRIPRTKGQ